MKKDWEIIDEIGEKAPDDPGFAIAWAILKLGETIGGLYEVLRTDHPLMGETLDKIADSLNNISTSIDGLAPPEED